MLTKKSILRFTFFSLYLVFFSLIFVELILEYIPVLALAFPFIQQGYSNICHQQTEKLISLGNGLHTILCARCTGIYSGGLLSSIALFLVNPNPRLRIKYLIFAASPLIIDAVFTSVGIYSYGKTAAFTTGLLLGSVGFLYFYIPLENLILNKNWR